jgi:hypothetical protein
MPTEERQLRIAVGIYKARPAIRRRILDKLGRIVVGLARHRRPRQLRWQPDGPRVGKSMGIKSADFRNWLIILSFFVKLGGLPLRQPLRNTPKIPKSLG